MDLMHALIDFQTCAMSASVRVITGEGRAFRVHDGV